MMLIWSEGGVKIPDICVYDAYTQTIIWTAWTDHNHYKWWAHIGPTGWRVILEDSRKLRSEIQGATFNVFLEVAAAIRRVS